MALFSKYGVGRRFGFWLRVAVWLKRLLYAAAGYYIYTRYSSLRFGSLDGFLVSSGELVAGADEAVLDATKQLVGSSSGVLGSAGLVWSLLSGLGTVFVFFKAVQLLLRGFDRDVSSVLSVLVFVLLYGVVVWAVERRVPFVGLWVFVRNVGGVVEAVPV